MDDVTEPHLTEDEVSAIFHLIRTNSDPSVHGHLESFRRLYEIERAQHQLTKLRIMHAQAALDMVYGHRVHGLKAVGE